jgi:hypothetical protein
VKLQQQELERWRQAAVTLQCAQRCAVARHKFADEKGREGASRSRRASLASFAEAQERKIAAQVI